MGYGGRCALLILILAINIIANHISGISSNEVSQTIKFSPNSESPQNISEDVVEKVNGVEGKLVFSHVIYRHGDRTPVSFSPTDPYNNAKEWPVGIGQLTNIGKEQHYELGQWLRKRYDGILNRTYSEKEIYVRATDVDRTLMSALANLAGLYPPVESQAFRKDMPWQPIPVHTIPEHLDSVLASKAPCAAYEYAFSALMNSPAILKMQKRYKYLYDYLSTYTGMNVASFLDVQGLNNTFYIEQLYNKTLPAWTTKVYPSNDMSYLAALSFSLNSYTREMARLRGGNLLKEMLDRFEEKTQGHLKPDRSIWIYSAHDNTIATVLNTLKVFDLHSPPYTACILFELRLNTQKQPFVSIFYKNTSAEPSALNIPNCGFSCPLHKMYALYEEVLPLDWNAECRLPDVLFESDDVPMGITIGALLSFLVAAFFLIYGVVFFYRRRNFGTYSSYTQVA